MTIDSYQNRVKNAIIEIKKLEEHRLDSDTKVLKEAFDICYDRGVFELYKVDASVHNAYKFILFSNLTQVSGSLAFLAVQILAGNAIMLGNAFRQREQYFSQKSGIAVNHFRAPVTVVRATRCEGGYRLKGQLSWASGYGIFDSLLIGFHYENQEYQAMVAFESTESFRIGEVSESFVGNSMATVNIELDDFFVAETNIVSMKPKGSYTQVRSVSKTIHFALYGLGLGAIEQLQDTEIKEEAKKRLETKKEAFMMSEEGKTMERLRVELFLLVQQIVTTGMVLHGGKSILIEETMQRYYRELIMFNANGLNATIKALFRDTFLS